MRRLVGARIHVMGRVAKVQRVIGRNWMSANALMLQGQQGCTAEAKVQVGASAKRHPFISLWITANEAEKQRSDGAAAICEKVRSKPRYRQRTPHTLSAGVQSGTVFTLKS